MDSLALGGRQRESLARQGVHDFSLLLGPELCKLPCERADGLRDTRAGCSTHESKNFGVHAVLVLGCWGRGHVDEVADEAQSRFTIPGGRAD